MPISSQVPIIGYVANGVTKSFAFPFAILSADDLKVKVGADVVTTGFSIAGVGDRDGGSVTFTDAPASLTPIILYREVTLDRTTDYQENGDLLAIVLDDDLDRIWMALQDQLLLADRAVRAPIGETLQQLPPASERALMALAFDAAGNPIVVRGTNDGGAALALDLMDTAPGKGAELVGADDGASGSLWTTVAGFIAFLLSTLGASVVGYVRVGTGAVARKLTDLITDRPVTFEEFGGVGNGTADDSDAIEKAFNTGRSINVTDGKTFLVKRRITWAASYVTLSGGGKMKAAADFDVSAGNLMVMNVTGAGVTIDNVVFDATGAPSGAAVENGFIWCTNAGLTVTSKAKFIGLPKGTCIWGLANAPFMRVTGAWFNNCRAAVFTKGRGCTIADNTIVNAYDAAIALNGTSCVGATVTGNTIINDNLTALPSMIAVEEGASAWTITGNALIGANGGGILCTNVLDTTTVRGGVIADNVVRGSNFAGTVPSNPNPAALVYVSQYYTDCTIDSNQIYDCPAGNAASRLLSVGSQGHVVSNNIIDGTATAGLSAMIDIRPGTKGLLIDSNTTRSVGRHYLFASGDYNTTPVRFVGGRFYGGSEGINTELNAGSITNIRLYIKDIVDSSVSPSLVNAATAIGDRAAFLNAGGWARPHTIGVFTNMYASGVAASSGALAFQNGDQFQYLAPTAGGNIGYVRVAGAWKNYGAVSA